MTEIFPAGITANRETSELIIDWKDGHSSRIPLSLLREACPCAECRGGHDKMSSTPPSEVFELEIEDSPRTRLNNIEAVGTYALNPHWEDGHQFGIYTWEYLRALCPCPICQGIEGVKYSG
jgi:DUF971 family protein